MVNKEGKILHKSRHHKKGRKQHDYSVYKDEHPVTPPLVKNYFDLGYHGIENDFPNMKVVLTIKKKRNIELTQKEKRDTTKDIVDKESNSRTHYLKNKKIWYYGKQIQKQTKEI